MRGAGRKVKGSLAQMWPELPDKQKTPCLSRSLGSYYFLDRCIKSVERDSAKTE